jgi:cAMP-dependent protein kinase regulator
MNLDSEHKSQIIAEMYKTEIKEGVSAITQGTLGDNLYVVESGTFNVFVNQKQVATRGKGTCFGELALMYNSPRAATVTAATHCTVWVVDRFTFRRIVTDLSEKRFGVYVGFLKKVELLMPLAEYERKKIAEALEETTISAATTVFKQGDIGDSMYLVYSGELKITKNENGVEKELIRVKEGDYFGSVAGHISDHARHAETQGPRINSSPGAAEMKDLRIDARDIDQRRIVCIRSMC